MLRRRRSANSNVDAATVAALRTTINTITAVAKVGATLIARATSESDEVVAWRAPAMREVEMEEVAIVTVRALGEFYKQNRKAINLIVRAYMLYLFLSMVLQLALALLQIAFTCLFTLFIFIVLSKLPLASHADLIFS
ncbi:hypothetical protein FRC04_006980 [Tulasnella sp. 424]|nr:hypothetical protein FRC04_006980 [Tulasnella sp. 424]KAG8966058.1 hypothetical protein FRC05_002899 [Tulasnella sp. 425]